MDLFSIHHTDHPSVADNDHRLPTPPQSNTPLTGSLTEAQTGSLTRPLTAGAQNGRRFGGQSSALNEMESLFANLVEHEQSDHSCSNSLQSSSTHAGPASTTISVARKAEHTHQDTQEEPKTAQSSRYLSDINTEALSINNRLGNSMQATESTTAHENNMRTQSTNPSTREIDFESIGEAVDEFIDSIIALFKDIGEMIKDIFSQISDTIETA